MRKNTDLLRVLHRAKPKLRKAILKHVDSSCIKAICDCVLNILKNIVKTSINLFNLRNSVNTVAISTGILLARIR